MTTSTTKPYDAEEIEAARKLFEGPWDFVWASTKIDELSPDREAAAWVLDRLSSE